MEVIQAFLNNFTVNKDTDGKPITHTGMPPFPGKWSIPEKKLPKFYKLISECYAKGSLHIPIVEKMRDNFPFVIDIDLKYKKELSERQYNSDNIEKLLEYLWSKIDACVENANEKNTVFLMEKAKPYPCNKGNYKTKDGIHLSFPDIIIEKSVYKKLISIIQSEDKIQSIFSEGCEVGPDNDTKGILDSSFSSWQLYGCGKPGETPYIVTKVYKFAEDGYPEELEQEIFDEYYTDVKTILNKMTMCYIKKDNVSYKDEFMKTLKVKKSTSSSSVSSMKNDDDIYGTSYYVDNNNVINPFELLQEEELKLVKGLVGCLSKERAEDYGKWFDVALCLRNINPNLLDTWKEFSRQAASYDPHVCDDKWKSINTTHGGERLGIGSLIFWARNDNEKEFIRVKNKSLSTYIHKSVSSGADADYLVAKVIHKYYEDEFISVNVKDEWFHFNGQRWERTLEGTCLKTRIHNDIFNLYNEYENDPIDGYRKRMTDAAAASPDPDQFLKESLEGKTNEGKLLKSIKNFKGNNFMKKIIIPHQEGK